MRQPTTIVYLAVDDFLPPGGRPILGFEEFVATLEHAAVPSVWLTSRTRLQLDEPRRKLGHSHPFVTEEGCGVFLPEDYFHLRPQSATSRSGKPGKATTTRIGRFTCIPVAEQQPASAEALESISAETGVAVVPLRSLSPRELAQNLGLPPREAELARQRDFDELFFFAGASPLDIEGFRAAAADQKVQIRPRGVLFSLAIGASLSRCVRELSQLYDRALRSHALSIGISAAGGQNELPAVLDRHVLLTPGGMEEEDTVRASSSLRLQSMTFHGRETWTHILARITNSRA